MKVSGLLESTLVAVALSASISPTLSAQETFSGCLYVVTTGASARPYVPCAADADPKELANDPLVLRGMKTLGIDRTLVHFRSCNEAVFSTAERHLSTSNARPDYVVTYPIALRSDYLAPIIHELAHVLQMESAGGFQRLIATASSKQIELGADYLTGLVFAQAFPELPFTEFQINAAISARYQHEEFGAHGTPGQRTAAFRRGEFQDFERVDRDFAHAYDYFRDNIYEIIVWTPASSTSGAK